MGGVEGVEGVEEGGKVGIVLLIMNRIIPSSL